MVKGLLLQSLWIRLCYSQKRNWRRTQNPLRNVHTTVFGNHFPASEACLLGVEEFPREIYFQSEAILVKFLNLQSESLVTRLKPAWLASVYSVYRAAVCPDYMMRLPPFSGARALTKLYLRGRDRYPRKVIFVSLSHIVL